MTTMRRPGRLSRDVPRQQAGRALLSAGAGEATAPCSSVQLLPVLHEERNLHLRRHICLVSAGRRRT